MGLVKILKASLVVTLQYLAGNPVNDTRPLGLTLSLRNGLPRWLPHTLRIEIRRKNVVWIRIVCSILNAYKAIKCKGQGTFSTIEAPSFTEAKNDQALLEDFKNFSVRFWESIPCQDRGFDGAKYVEYPLTTKAGPNHPIAFLDMMYSLLAYARLPKKASELEQLLKLQGMDSMAARFRKHLDNVS
jgi:hypothetical protein